MTTPTSDDDAPEDDGPDDNGPDYDAAALERGRLLFAKECEFQLGAVDLKGLPATDYPEIAFAGRSNVGKSSLINALTGRKTLARTSDTPGRTQQINFFLLGAALMLVDLPGYGYAKVSRSQSKKWTALKKGYLRGRANLRRAMLLVDARRGVKPPDLEIMDMLDETAVNYQVALTKIDKLKDQERDAVFAATKGALARRPAAHPVVIATSARDGLGIAELRAELAALSDWKA